MKAACEAAHHAGDRLTDRRDLLERRIEWRRLTDQGRELVRVTARVCKTCARSEAASLDALRGREFAGGDLEGQAALI